MWPRKYLLLYHCYNTNYDNNSQYCLHEHHQAGKLGGRPPGALLVEEVRGCELNFDMAIPSGPRLQG
jgi:hypothetical protein